MTRSIEPGLRIGAQNESEIIFERFLSGHSRQSHAMAMLYSKKTPKTAHEQLGRTAVQLMRNLASRRLLGAEMPAASAAPATEKNALAS